MSKISLCTPDPSDLPGLSALQLRSKSHWGYDADFMDACVEELTLHPDDLTRSALIVAETGGTFAGVAQVGPDSTNNADAHLLGLFIDPPFIGTGLGARLFEWAVDAAREYSATRLLIESDPQAAPFYRRMGAVDIGDVPSNAIPGRRLPLLEYRLR